MKRPILLVALLALVMVSSAFAAPDTPLIGHAAFGWVGPQGKAGDAVNSGWNFSGGATFFENPKRPVGVRVDFSYNWFYATKGTVESANGGPAVSRIDDGFASMTTVTLDSIYDFSHDGTFGSYFGLGFGLYSRYWQLTQTALVGGIWCDPWTNICYPATVPGQVVADSDRLTKLGANVILGLTMKMHSGSQLYLEGGYHWMDTSPSTDYIPILFGARW